MSDSTYSKIICLEEKSIKLLVTEVLDQVKKENVIKQDAWIDEKEAMELLKVKAKNTFYKYRDEGKGIDHRRLSAKHILYRRKAVLDFIENSPKTK